MKQPTENENAKRGRSRIGLCVFSLLLCVWSYRCEAAELTQPLDQEAPERVLTLESLSAMREPVIPKTWSAYAMPGIQFDNNLNHLLINATTNSNVRLPDQAIYTAAGGQLKPDWGRRWWPTLGYNFERNDYQNHRDFSYYSHNLYGSLHYWMIVHWGLDLSADSTWFGDRTGLVARTHNVYGALLWYRLPWRVRLGTGYHQERYVFATPNDAGAHLAFVEASRDIGRRHFAFADYWYRYARAEDKIFSYQMHYAEMGWVTNWTWRWRTFAMASFQYKPFAFPDPRFGPQPLDRQDHTYNLILRPSYAFYPAVRLNFIYNYQVNYSSIEAKRYFDQIYTLLLEVRL